MEETLWNSRQQIRSLLEESGLTLKKRFGQNFLVDEAHRARIVGSLGCGAGDSVWEIGPGIGSITSRLLDTGCMVTAFEIDFGLIRVLERLFASAIGEGRLRIVAGDFLKTFREELDAAGSPSHLIGNLPYSSGSVMVGDLIEADALPPVSVFTLQKEVALRMAARPGSGDYSAFSLVSQLRCRVERIGDVGGGAFFPPPQVTSSIVRLERREDAPAGSCRLYFDLVHDLFRARRKTAANNLKSGRLAARLGIEHVLNATAAAGIDLKRRGETFSRQEVLRLVEALET